MTVGLLRTAGREAVGLLGVTAVDRGGSAPAGTRQAIAPGGITRRAGHVKRGAGRIATVHRSAPLRSWVSVLNRRPALDKDDSCLG
jgi:hypothetical protein